MDLERGIGGGTGDDTGSGTGDGTDAAAVFDALGADYERAFAASPAHLDSLRRLIDALPPGSRVLDVGSGTGRPTARTLVDAGHHIQGIDVSPVMVELASRQVPEASFLRADIRTTDLADASFDAVCVYFSLLQMDRTEQADVLRRLARALVPGGLLAVATVPLDVEATDVVFMGQTVRVTSFGADAFAATVTASGFSVLWQEAGLFAPDHADATPEPQLFLHARRD
ncbi:class I SAM-dependent methyltransferase [Streptomyces yaizuensis]|uniref:Class I SAM-dependent methyltransferase n=1 Tax=Streptomyces yaizuensis TaxID=2989713 RepID=A0ABQ5P9E7_9ACTN|nr:class I SAM-dependent methyltransferase [Streptomyces sp. YSPA8]GLF99191.1 class I SAM-dependent methyltransferase [Streptomyces sp. YSPA8]